MVSYRNALDICNHAPPPPPPPPRGGRGIAVERGVFTFPMSPQCRGNTRDLYYVGKYGSAIENITDCRGKGPLFYQLGVPAVRGF